jgi:hypothetical protein
VSHNQEKHGDSMNLLDALCRALGPKSDGLRRVGLNWPYSLLIDKNG